MTGENARQTELRVSRTKLLILKDHHLKGMIPLKEASLNLHIQIFSTLDLHLLT